MLQTTTYVCQGKDLFLTLTRMRDIILSRKMKEYLRRRYKLDLYQTARLYVKATQKLKNYPEEIYYDTNNSAKGLLKEWERFSKSDQVISTIERRGLFISLWERTQVLLNDILKGTKLGRHKNKEVVRRRSTKDIDADLKNLGTRINDILAQIDREKKRNEDADPIRLQSLQEDLDDVRSQVKLRQQEQVEQKEEDQVLDTWDKRIEEAFNILKHCTSSIEEEKSNVAAEYVFYNYCMGGVAFFILVWMLFLYRALFVDHVYFSGWISFLPYYLPVPLIAALLWVLIVQKNRANKLSITISEELFRVRYLEGLLLMVNKLSKNSDTSIARINKAIDAMVDSYLHQTERMFLNEDKIGTIEKEEVNANKLMQWMDKLIDKV